MQDLDAPYDIPLQKVRASLDARTFLHVGVALLRAPRPEAGETEKKRAGKACVGSGFAGDELL